jgi:uncharacterized phage protein (TIGR01671 family)
MREMKVRGYSLDEGHWIKGFGAEYNDDLETYLVHNYRGFFEVDGESIGEYTGYKDINDIEICEGDIVETTRALNHIVGVVTMIKGCWYIQDGKNSYYRLIPRFGTAENKVIGNIYENKNLLEED